MMMMRNIWNFLLQVLLKVFTFHLDFCLKPLKKRVYEQREQKDKIDGQIIFNTLKIIKKSKKKNLKYPRAATE
jgi:hypothetical protein